MNIMKRRLYASIRAKTNSLSHPGIIPDDRSPEGGAFLPPSSREVSTIGVPRRELESVGGSRKLTEGVFKKLFLQEKGGLTPPFQF